MIQNSISGFYYFVEFYKKILYYSEKLDEKKQSILYVVHGQ